MWCRRGVRRCRPGSRSSDSGGGVRDDRQRGLLPVGEDIDERAAVDGLRIGRDAEQSLAQPAVEAADDVGQGPGLDDAAAVEQGNRVADALDDVHLVRDDQDGEAAAAADLHDQVEDLVGRLRIEGGGGLVEQQHVGVGGQGAGDADPLPHAAGQLGGVGLAGVGEPHEPQQLGDLRRPGRLVDADELERVAHVVGDGAGVEEVGLLEHESDPTARGTQGRVTGRGQVNTVDLDAAGGRAVEESEAAHEGRLAGAGVADDAVDGTLRHREAHPVEGAHLAATLVVDLR